MPVNVQDATIIAGAITLTGSSTGSGLYNIICTTPDQVLSFINGGNGHALITVKPWTPGVYFYLTHDGTHKILAQESDFAPATVRDRITLRDELGDGTLWVEEITRVHFSI